MLLHSPGVAGITVLYQQAWGSESFKYEGDCVAFSVSVTAQCSAMLLLKIKQ